MKRRAVLVCAALLCVLLASTGGSAEIKRTPGGHLGSLNIQQQQDLFNALFFSYLQQGNPVPVAAQLAQNVVQQTTVVMHKNAPQLVVTLTEECPGDIEPCLAVAFPDNTVQFIDIETKQGDGQYSGQPLCLFHFQWGGVAIFEGVPSVNDPMKLHVNVQWQ